MASTISSKDKKHSREEKREERKEKKEKKPKTEKQTDLNPKAKPMCTEKVTKKVYDLLVTAKNNKILKVGVNEVIKKLNKGDADLVIIAGSSKPFAIVEPIMHLCENKNRTFYFVPSTTALGKACGLSRPVAACVIMYSEQGTINKTINEIRNLMKEE
ncbi:U4/U6 small nuclear ribonucleoprotein SNU13 [Nematocida sp. AWRm80]|nr:U4/U6 small nuclear ribonucleoprotein SNU13 [Nematocida sp. AWRm80]